MKNSFKIKLERINSAGQVEDSLVIEEPQDTDLEEWKNIFATLLLFMTFSPGLIQSEFLKEEIE